MGELVEVAAEAGDQLGLLQELSGDRVRVAGRGVDVLLVMTTAVAVRGLREVAEALVGVPGEEPDPGGREVLVEQHGVAVGELLEFVHAACRCMRV